MKELLLYGNQNLQNYVYSAAITNLRDTASQDITRTKLLRQYGSVVTDSRPPERNLTIQGKIRQKDTGIDYTDLLDDFNVAVGQKDVWLRHMPTYKTLFDGKATTHLTGSNGATSLAVDNDEFQYDKDSVKFDIDVSSGTSDGYWHKKVFQRDDYTFGVSAAVLQQVSVAYNPDSNYYVIGYTDREGSDSEHKTYIQIVTTSGNSLTFQKPIKIFDEGTTVEHPKIVYHKDEGDFLVAYYKADDNDLLIDVLNINQSTNTATLGGSPATLNAPVSDIDDWDLVYFDGIDQCVFYVGRDADAALNAAVVSWNGASFSVAAGISISSTYTDGETVHMKYLEDLDRLVISYTSTAGVSAVRLVSASGTTLTLEGSDTYTTANSLGFAYDPDNDQIIMITDENNSSAANTFDALYFDVTASTITASSAQTITFTGVTASRSSCSVMYDSFLNKFFAYGYFNDGTYIMDLTISGGSISEGTPQLVSNYSEKNTQGEDKELVHIEDEVTGSQILINRNTATMFRSFNNTYSTITYDSSGAETIDISSEAVREVPLYTNVNDTVENTALRSGSFGFWIYLPNQFAFNKIDFRIGSSSSNYYMYNDIEANYMGKPLETGWNFIVVDWVKMTDILAPTASAIDYFEIKVHYNQTSYDFEDVRIDGVMYIDEDDCRNYRCYTSSKNITHQGGRIGSAIYSLNLLNYEGVAFSTFRYLLTQPASFSLNASGSRELFNLELYNGGSYETDFYLEHQTDITIQTVLAKESTGEAIKYGVEANETVTVDGENKQILDDGLQDSFTGNFFKLDMGINKINFFVYGNSASSNTVNFEARRIYI